MEWDFEMRESPMALAYHYLNDLPLCPETIEHAGDPLGELDFIEGDRPGSNLTYVRSPTSDLPLPSDSASACRDKDKKHAIYPYSVTGSFILS
jgi:hypothetical protein